LASNSWTDRSSIPANTKPAVRVARSIAISLSPNGAPVQAGAPSAPAFGVSRWLPRAIAKRRAGLLGRVASLDGGINSLVLASGCRLGHITWQDNAGLSLNVGRNNPGVRHFSRLHGMWPTRPLEPTRLSNQPTHTITGT